MAKSELDLLLSTEQKEQCKLEQLEQKYNSSTSGLAEKKAKIAEHQKKIPELNKKIAGFEEQISKCNKEYEELSRHVRGMRSNFEETRSNQAASKSRGKVHDALMKQKQNGSIKGNGYFWSVIFNYSECFFLLMYVLSLWRFASMVFHHFLLQAFIVFFGIQTGYAARSFHTKSAFHKVTKE